MKQITSIVLFICMMQFPLFAKDIYIKTMTVSKKFSKREVAKLKSANYNVYTQGYKNFIRIYVGPFKSMQSARKSLKKVKKDVARDAFITKLDTKSVKSVKLPKEPSKAVALTPVIQKVKKSNSKSNSKPKLKQKKELKTEVKPLVVATPVIQKAPEVVEAPKEVVIQTKHQPKKRLENTEQIKKETPKLEDKQTEDNKKTDKVSDKDYFIGVSAGFGNVNIDKTGNMPLDIELKDAATSYGLEGGYNFSDNFFITLNYQYTNLKDFYLHNLYTTLDYRFGRGFYLSPYIGVVGGFNAMNWRNYPVNSINSIAQTYSYLVGGQVGSDIDVSDSFAFYVVYKYWIMDYKTSISGTTNSKEIDFTSEQNLNFGIKYKF